MRWGTFEVPSVCLTFCGLEAGRVYVVLDSVVHVQLQVRCFKETVVTMKSLTALDPKPGPALLGLLTAPGDLLGNVSCWVVAHRHSVRDSAMVSDITRWVLSKAAVRILDQRVIWLRDFFFFLILLLSAVTDSPFFLYQSVILRSILHCYLGLLLLLIFKQRPLASLCYFTHDF